MENYDLGFTTQKEEGKIFLQLNGSAWPKDVGGKIVVNGKNYSFAHGTTCFWIFREDEPLGVKFFIGNTFRKLRRREYKRLLKQLKLTPEQHPYQPGNRFYLAPVTLERAKEIFKIQKILFDNGVAPEPKEIVTCSVNGKRAGYGMIMEKIIPIKASGVTSVGNAFTTDLINILKRNSIDFIRRNSHGHITMRGLDGKIRVAHRGEVKEASLGKSQNIFLTKKGYMLVDVQEFYL